MPRSCSICTHPRSREINLALANRLSYSKIAKDYPGFSEAALSRHRNNCFVEVVRAGLDYMDEYEREVAEGALNTTRQLIDINREAWAVLEEARAEGDRGDRLKAIDRVQNQIEYQSKLLGDLQPESPRPLISPVAMQVIIQAVSPYPELASQLVDALEPLEELEELEEAS
jgi:hypothetical protein